MLFVKSWFSSVIPVELSIPQIIQRRPYLFRKTCTIFDEKAYEQEYFILSFNAVTCSKDLKVVKLRLLEPRPSQLVSYLQLEVWKLVSSPVSAQAKTNLSFEMNPNRSSWKWFQLPSLIPHTLFHNTLYFCGRFARIIKRYGYFKRFPRFLKC